MGDDGKSRELADGVVQVFLPLPFKPTIVNVYLVRAGRTWTLVDTGMHTGDSRRAFEAVLAEHGIAPRDVTRIVCTHHHIDHYGTSGPYRDLTRASVFLHPLEAERAAASATATGENEAWNARTAFPRRRPRSACRRRLGRSTLYRPRSPTRLADGDDPARRLARVRGRVDARPQWPVAACSSSPTASSSSATTCSRRSRRTSGSTRTGPRTRSATS
jgi:glyoxylase-like metal-dependent hydrolase (beta-lactamase superfamily II)